MHKHRTCHVETFRVIREPLRIEKGRRRAHKHNDIGAEVEVSAYATKDNLVFANLVELRAIAAISKEKKNGLLR